MLPQWALNPGFQPFESDDLLSELLWYVLPGRFKIFIWSCSIGSNKMIEVQNWSGELDTI